MTWNSRCGPPNGWARPCCSRLETDHPLLRAPPRPGTAAAAEIAGLPIGTDFTVGVDHLEELAPALVEMP
jgi:hypothetical protein